MINNNIKISPSILAADFSILKDEIQKIDTADLIHIDIMDMHFVPNLTFGVKLIQDIKKHTNIPFDVHLMVEKPENYIYSLKDCADIITVHYESSVHLERLVNEIKKLNKKVGIALNPSTNEDVLKYIINDIDLILVMTVNPGFGGQKFINSQLDKISSIRKIINEKHLNIDLEVDGGINFDTAKLVKNAGANVLVSGSYIFSSKDYNRSIETLR